MSICSLEHDYINTSNALILQMSGKQICLQVPPKLFRVNSWNAQIFLLSTGQKWANV